MGNSPTETLTQIAKQTQAVMMFNPMSGPHVQKFWQAQENALQEAEKFCRNWFSRRHQATLSALETTQDIAQVSASDPSRMVRGLAEWQRQSLERMTADVQEWMDLCNRCAGHFASAEAEAEKEDLKEATKRTQAAAKPKHAIPV